MQRTVFDYQDYKDYLRDWLNSRPGRGRGEKSKIAAALRCHTAYITHVFRGSAHFSPEQASELSAYLGHREQEQHFFLLLVQLARAGNPSLRSYLEREIRKVLEARLLLKNRFNVRPVLSEEDHSTYYSAWHYSAIYAMTSVPGFQTPEAISKGLQLPLKKVSEILDFLVSTGLVKIEKGRYKVGPTSLHLPNDSPMIAKHHTNWRIQAIRSLDQPKVTDLHYSSVVSLSKEDLPRIRAVLVKAIEDVRAIVKASPEKTVCAYAFDLFEVVEQ